MNLFRRSRSGHDSFTTPTEKRSSPKLTGRQVMQLLGQVTDPGTTSTEGALEKSGAALRATSVVAGTVASFPLKAYRDTAKGRTEAVSALLRNPHRDLTAFEWKELLVTHLIGWGDAFLAVEVDGAGAPLHLDPILPGLVTPHKIEPSTANPSGRLYEVTLGEGKKKTLRPWVPGVTTDGILHIPNLGYDGLRGLSVIGAVRQAVTSGIAAEEFASKLWKSGALHTGIVTIEGITEQEELDRAEKSWRDKHNGADPGPLFLAESAKFTPTTMNPADAQWLESRQFTTAEIAHMFGLNDDLTAPSAAEFHRTLLPYLKRIEERVSRLLPRGQFAEFNVAGYLRADVATRYGAYSIGLQNGFVTLNDILRSENKPTIGPEGDVYKPLAPNTGTPNAHVNEAPSE